MGFPQSTDSGVTKFDIENPPKAFWNKKPLKISIQILLLVVWESNTFAIEGLCPSLAARETWLSGLDLGLNLSGGIFDFGFGSYLSDASASVCPCGGTSQGTEIRYQDVTVG